MATNEPPGTPTAAERISVLPGGSYVALGDSLSAGLEDRYADGTSPHSATPQGGYRGFTDLLALRMTAERPDLRYANLAIRGRAVAHILGEQVDQALALRPGVVTITAGGNDIMDTGFDAGAVAARYERGVRRLRSAGAEVVMVGLHDIGTMPVLRWGRDKVRALNERLAEVAERNDCVFVDLYRLPVLRDPRAFDPDRVHYNAAGHLIVAAHVGERIGLPFPHSPHSMGWSDPAALLNTNGAWVRRYVLPALYRNLTGRTTGDGVPPKRPTAAPLANAGEGARLTPPPDRPGLLPAGDPEQRRLAGWTARDVRARSIAEVAHRLRDSPRTPGPAAARSQTARPAGPQRRSARRR
ncbi:SGNH/GDSL hydrolase family protein [Marinactinospora rubrisoli]|uniref:SGNH/GDSL hydrolase family protein n=1 Tax=Marinactinospora rubrisoli TaxID=2715399 RepID=A0ABW2KFY8_9ACTN